MRIRVLRTLVALVALAGLVGATGCGNDEPDPAGSPPETVDELPKLPQGWKPYVNHRAGFAIGRPPGWHVERRGVATLLRSPDQLVAVSISADRTTDAIEFPLDDYALGAAEALPGFEDLDVAEPHPLNSHYDAVAVEARGKTEDGLSQRLEFIAMRRDELVTYAVLIARNAEQASAFYAEEAERMVRTLRGRPIG